MHPIRAALVASLALATQASPVSGQVPPKLHWQRTPTVEDVRRVFPAEALRKGVSGGAMIGCDVVPNGELLHCKAYADAPPGLGFGDAGVMLAGYFRLSQESIASLPVPGRIAIPMAFGAPGRPTPRLSFQLSDSALLLTNFEGARGPGGTSNVDCLAAAPPRKCVMHFITWTARPNVMTTLATTLRAGKTSGSDLALCWVAPGGALTDCQGSGPEAKQLITALAAGFTAPARADDGSPVGPGPIMITLNWSALSAAAQAMNGDKAAPSPASTGR